MWERGFRAANTIAACVQGKVDLMLSGFGRTALAVRSCCEDVGEKQALKQQNATINKLHKPLTTKKD